MGKNGHNLFEKWQENRLLLLTIFVFFVFLRIAFSFSNFSIDEILSLETARASSWIFHSFYLREDNNHLINTIYLYLVKDFDNWVVFRFHSVFFGALTILLPYFFLKNRKDDLCFFSVSLFFGFSFFLITYQSEARGYSALIFASFFAYFLQNQWFEGASNRKWPIYFFFANLLGAISHPTFYFFFLALFVSAVVRVSFIQTLKNYALSLLALSVVYLGFYKDLVVLGSSTRYPAEVITRAMSLGFGLSGMDWHILLTLLLPLLLFLIFILAQKRGWSDLFFYIALLGVNTAYPYLQGSPEQVSERYFLLPAIFGGYLFTVNLANWDSLRWKNHFLLAFLALYIGTNSYFIVNYFRLGARGSYAQALEYLAEKEPSEEIFLAGYQDFRILTLLRFYAHEAKKSGKKLTYIPQQQKKAHWFLTESQWHMRAKKEKTLFLGQLQLEPPPEEIEVFGAHYSLIKIFPQYGITGSQWALYRNKEAVAVVP